MALPIYLVFKGLDFADTDKKSIICCLHINGTLFILEKFKLQFEYPIRTNGLSCTTSHTNANRLPHNPLLNSLWYRFYPYYFEQALNPVILYGMILMIFGFFIKQKMWRKPNDWIYGSWILGILIIFTVLTPQYRYLPIFWISGILLLIQSKRVNFMAPAIKGIALLLFVNLSFSFLGRHSAALIQAKSRNPVYVYDFLHKYLPNPKKNRTLILGESIGFYYAHRGRNHHTFDYGIDFYPQHFNWSDYDHVVLLSHEVRPQDSLIAIYESPKESFKTPTTMKAFAKGGTYDGMRVYSLK